MPRIRSLKPDLWQSESLGSTSIEAMCLFVGLITQADDEGRLRGSVGRLRATLWPYKPTLDTARVERWLDELTARDLVQRYEVNGKPFICLPGWTEHQRIDRPSRSDIPAPPTHRMGVDEQHGEPDDAAPDSTSPREPSLTIASIPAGSGSGSGSTPSASELAMVARRLFAYWQDKCGHPTAKFTPERRRKVEARLKEGYMEHQVRQAIDGAARAAFVNDAGKRFDDIELICRNGSKLEDFIGRTSAQPRSQTSSADIAAALARKSTTPAA